MVFAIIPILIWGGVALAAAIGGAIAVAASQSGDSSSGNDSSRESSSPKQRGKPFCLLAGWKGAGKTEFICSLKDYYNNSGQRKSHAVGDTISSGKVVISGMNIECYDGPGNFSGGQNERYRYFLEDAFKYQEMREYVVVFIVDLTTLSDIETKRRVKSDMELLNQNAKDIIANNQSYNGKKIQMLVVGSHLDKMEGEFDYQQNFAGWMNGLIAQDVFVPAYVMADLYSDCSAAKEFVEKYGG